MVEQTANFARDKGLSVTESLLAGMTTPPDVIVAANDDMALGAIEAVKARGLADKVKIIGFDALPEALAAVRDGALAGTVEQFPGGQSRKAMQIMVELPQGQDEARERSGAADPDRDHQGQPRQGRAPRRGEVGRGWPHGALAVTGAARARSCA